MRLKKKRSNIRNDARPSALLRLSSDIQRISGQLGIRRSTIISPFQKVKNGVFGDKATPKVEGRSILPTTIEKKKACSPSYVEDVKNVEVSKLSTPKTELKGSPELENERKTFESKKSPSSGIRVADGTAPPKLSVPKTKVSSPKKMLRPASGMVSVDENKPSLTRSDTGDAKMQKMEVKLVLSARLIILNSMILFGIWASVVSLGLGLYRSDGIAFIVIFSTIQFLQVILAFIQSRFVRLLIME